MRIRQVRPEFWTDPVTARLTPPAMLTYIGLWGVADDAGWLTWNVEQIGALLYPYKSGHVRTRMVSTASDQLVEAGRMVLHPCGCAHIPTLETHQRIGGNKSFTGRDKHRVHTSMDKSARNVTLGNVTERNVIQTRERDDGETASEFRKRAGVPAFLGGES